MSRYEAFWGKARRRKKGGTRKIADLPGVCPHPEHKPPAHRVFEPGVYEAVPLIRCAAT
jgi:hypothetical protein